MQVLKDLVFTEFQFQIQKPYKMNHEEKREKADSIILSHVGFAASAALLPLPIADIAAVGAVQLNMLRQLASLYRVGFIDALGKNIISALVGSSLARVGASLIKLIPGVGTAIGEFTMPALSAASTYALGQVVASHFAKGGSLDDFDFKMAKRKYDEEIKKGKEVAKNTAAQAEAVQEDPIAKLKKLAELKAAGILSEDEFAQMKAKLLAQV
jgi:uncharacterized protein (DUF697 family)